MKVMKKTLAVLLSVLMIISVNAGIVFADGETTYPIGEEFVLQTAAPKLVTSNGAATWKDLAGLSGNVALFGIDLPKLDTNQTVKKFTFEFTTTYQGNRYMAPIAFVVPYEMIGYSESGEPNFGVADLLDVQKNSTALSFVEDVHDPSAFPWPHKTSTIDITTLAIDAYNNNQKCVYIGVTATNSTQIFSTNMNATYASYGIAPKYSFVLKYADDNSVYENDVEQTIQVSNSTDPSYLVEASGANPWKSRTSVHSAHSKAAVYRIPLPTVSKYQKINNFSFKYTATHSGGAMNTTAYFIPGSWDNMASMTFDKINSVMTEATKLSVIKNERRDGVFTWPVADVTVDVTKYASEAIDAGEKYIYVGVVGWWTDVFSTVVNGSEVNMGLYPMYSFTLGAYSETTESDVFTNGSAYHITAGSDPKYFAMDILANAQYSGGNFVLFALPVPSIEKGYEISSYRLNAFVYRNDAMFALKFPGENWNLVSDAEKEITGMRFGDENVSAIISDWAANKGASSYNAADGITYANNRATVDLTTYMNECIKKGQKTCYVAMICEYSCGLYGFRPGKAEGANISYTLKYDCDALGVKIANADAKGTNYDSFENVTSLESGASYKAVGGFINKSLTDGKATLIIAKYNDADKLLGVKYAKDVVMSARNANGYIESEAITVDGECAVVKAFIWENGEIVPLCESAVAKLN